MLATKKLACLPGIHRGLLLSCRRHQLDLNFPEKLVRRGASLIEVLLVLAIIGLMIGLLLPAVQKIRSRSSELAHCNHLKQVNLATMNFADANHGTLPGRFAYDTLQYRSKQVFVLILPYLEQQALYSAFTGNPLALFDAPRQGVEMYFHPRDPTRSLQGGPGFGVGVNVRASLAENFCVFFEQSSSIMADGNSNTIFFAEHYSICGDKEYLFPSEAGTSFANRFDGDASPFVKPLPVPFQHRPRTGECDPRLIHASGPSGLYCGMGDGSVRLFSPSVNRSVFWAAVTPAGGEVVEFD